MPDFSLEREVRTLYSVVYTIRDGSDQIGRVDIHFADHDNMVAISLIVVVSLAEETIHDLTMLNDNRLLKQRGYLIRRRSFKFSRETRSVFSATAHSSTTATIVRQQSGHDRPARYSAGKARFTCG